MSYPTYNELYNYIKNNPRTSVKNICEFFNQNGTDSLILPYKNDQLQVIANNINIKFYYYLEDFLKKYNVKYEYDPASSSVTHNDNEVFYPIVLLLNN